MDSLSIQIYQSFKADLEKLERESEIDVIAGEGRYKDLNVFALYTSFEDLQSISTHSEVNGVWIDLGGGSGRTCLTYSFLTNNSSINLEIDPSRVSVGNIISKKYNLPCTHLSCDLFSDDIPFGDTYFLYFPTGPILDRILWVLSQRVGFTLVVIESHGDLLDRISKEGGYLEIDRIALHSPRHDPSAYIFKKSSISTSPIPHNLSFRDEILIIKDLDGEWIASSLGLEWLGNDLYQFLHPPRTISWKSDFVKILSSEDESYILLSKISDLRKLGEVRIWLVDSEEYFGFIRKIRLTPFLGLEISTSELVEWSSISKITQGSSLCYDSSSCFFSLPVL